MPLPLASVLIGQGPANAAAVKRYLDSDDLPAGLLVGVGESPGMSPGWALASPSSLEVS